MEKGGRSPTLGFVRYSDDLFDAQIGGDQIAIRDEWPASLKARLAAALVSNNLGLGLDYAFKRYISVEDYEPSSSGRVDLIFEEVFARGVQAIFSAYAFEKNDFPEPEFFAGMSLLRGLQTLECAHKLAQRAYLFETIVVARTAMEQLAWSSYAANMPSADGVLSVTTQRAISMAKGYFPELGRLYGVTSKFAHWHPETHVATFNMGDEGFGVLSSASKYKPTTLAIVGMLLVTSMKIFEAHMDKFWPDRSTADLRAAKGGLTSITGAVVTHLRDSKGSFHSDLDAVWSLYVENEEVVS